MRVLTSIGFPCIFHVSSYSNSQQWCLRQAERWILRCCSWCSCWKGKWQLAALSSWKISALITLHLSTVFNHWQRLKRPSDVGLNCGFITLSVSITVNVNLMNSRCSICYLVLLWNLKKTKIRSHELHILQLPVLNVIAYSLQLHHTPTFYSGCGDLSEIRSSWTPF